MFLYILWTTKERKDGSNGVTVYVSKSSRLFKMSHEY